MRLRIIKCSLETKEDIGICCQYWNVNDTDAPSDSAETIIAAAVHRTAMS